MTFDRSRGELEGSLSAPPRFTSWPHLDQNQFAELDAHNCDAPQGRELLRNGGSVPAGCLLMMERTYEGNETLQLALELAIAGGAAQPQSPAPWKYDRGLYRRRNEIEQLFHRLKAYRRVFSRFDKLDVLFVGFMSSPSFLKPCVFVLTDPNSLLKKDFSLKLFSASNV